MYTNGPLNYGLDYFNDSRATDHGAARLSYSDFLSALDNERSKYTGVVLGTFNTSLNSFGWLSPDVVTPDSIISVKDPASMSFAAGLNLVNAHQITQLDGNPQFMNTNSSRDARALKVAVLERQSAQVGEKSLSLQALAASSKPLQASRGERDVANSKELFGASSQFVADASATVSSVKSVSLRNSAFNAPLTIALLNSSANGFSSEVLKANSTPRCSEV